MDGDGDGDAEDGDAVDGDGWFGGMMTMFGNLVGLLQTSPDGGKRRGILRRRLWNMELVGWGGGGMCAGG